MRLEVLHQGSTAAELGLEGHPSDLGFPFQGGESPRQPSVDVQCGRAVAKVDDCRRVQDHWVAKKLLVIALAKQDGFDETLVPATVGIARCLYHRLVQVEPATTVLEREGYCADRQPLCLLLEHSHCLRAMR